MGILDSGLKRVQLSGSTTVEPQSGDGNGNITYSSSVVATQIFNDSGADLTLTVGGVSFTVPDRMSFEARNHASPHTTASVVASGPWFSVGLR